MSWKDVKRENRRGTTCFRGIRRQCVGRTDCPAAGTPRDLDMDSNATQSDEDMEMLAQPLTPEEPPEQSEATRLYVYREATTRSS